LQACQLESFCLKIGSNSIPDLVEHEMPPWDFCQDLEVTSTGPPFPELLSLLNLFLSIAPLPACLCHSQPTSLNNFDNHMLLDIHMMPFQVYEHFAESWERQKDLTGQSISATWKWTRLQYQCSPTSAIANLQGSCG
jgi:hypothetical protein